MTDERGRQFEVGHAGASARARYERQRRKDAERLRRRFGVFAPVVILLAGPDRGTDAWRRGAEGEERVGAVLTRVVGEAGFVLHDRVERRGSRANIDHIAIVRSGVWVIDAKHYRGRLEQRPTGGLFHRRRALFVGRREVTNLVAGALRQRAVVDRVLASDVPVRAALCFTGVELSFFARPFSIDGVFVTWPKALARTLNAPGRLDPDARAALASTLGRAFPPYR